MEFDRKIDKINEMPIRRKLKKQKILEIEEQRKQEIEDFMKPYNELFKGEVEFDVGIRSCSFRYTKGKYVDDKLDVIRFEADYHFKDNLDEKLASFYGKRDSGFLHNDKMLPLYFNSFEDLRKAEATIQSAYNKELEAIKKKREEDQATEKLLDF